MRDEAETMVSKLPFEPSMEHRFALRDAIRAYGEACRRAGAEAMREAAAEAMAVTPAKMPHPPGNERWVRNADRVAAIHALPLPPAAEVASPAAGWRPNTDTVRRLVDEAISTCEPEYADETATAYTRSVLARRFSKVLRLPSPSEEARAG